MVSYSNMQSYLFFGPPGSGKGTQKDMLENMLKANSGSAITIETGQLLRDFVEEKDTIVKKYLSEVMEAGGLVPSAFPISTWVNKLMSEEGVYEHVIIDGAGRKLAEAKIIIELLHFLPDPKVHIIYLKVPDKEVMERLLKRGRYDDQEETIKNRLKVYKDKKTGTTASINFLKKNKEVTFHTIDGVGPIEEVHRRVCSNLSL